MTQPTFFKRPQPTTLADLATLTGAQLADASLAERVVTGTASLDRAGPMHLAFCEQKKYADQLARTPCGRLSGE